MRGALLALLSLAGCGSPPIPPKPSGDAGTHFVPDAGHAIPDGGGAPDAGPAPDAGSCPPPTGTVCPHAGPPDSLSCLSGVRVIRVESDPSGLQRYVLGFRQPVDHDDPNGPTFEQTVWLIHSGNNKPTVMMTTGYDLYESFSELAYRFDVNEVAVEHRFFGTSFPDGGQYDYRHLDIRQAAMDLHRIRVAFAGLYPKPWVSTGASKGGMTMVFYRRFFPCDVAGTVAYVAPHSESDVDPRYNTFLASVGGPTRAGCRDALINLQKQLLSRRDVVEAALNADAGYALLGGLDTAYEDSVINMYWAFWQYTTADDPTTGCPSLPAGMLSDAELITLGQYQLEGSTDEAIFPYVPYYYQAATQLGEALPYEANLTGLLLHPGAAKARNFIPPGIAVPAFDPAPMADIQSWLSSEGRAVVFVYGELDPWSAAQYDLGQSTDTFKAIAPANNHLSMMFDLSAPEQEVAMEKVEKWLGATRKFLRPPMAPPRSNEWLGKRPVPATRRP